MSSSDHPGDRQLLQYSDGELPAAEAERVRRHVSDCEHCRAEMEELRQTMDAFSRYWAEMGDRLPPPPAPWGDIRRRFDEADAAAASSWFDRLGGFRRWAPVAAAIVLMCGVVYRIADAPSARAAALLRKAVVAAESSKSAPRRIQIRTRTRRVTRLVGVAARSEAPPDEIEALFRAANYSWEDPLSAKSYLEWRDRLSDKRDEVRTEAGSYRIRTTTGSGEVIEATLKLRAADLRAVEGTLEFRNRERVEMTELPDEPAAPALVASGRPEAPRLPEESAEAATAGDELQVFAALRHLEADLGEPVEVKREDRQILVTGVGLDPARAQQIRDALVSLPRVAVRFSEPPAAPSDSAAAPGAAVPSPGAEVARLQAKLAGEMGGRASFEHLAEQALEQSEAMMARAHALRRLSQRFTPVVELQMSSQERQLLHDLRGELTQSFHEQQTRIQRLMSPVLRGPVPSPGPDSPRFFAAGSWQAATEELFQAARRADQLVTLVFAGAGAETAVEPLEPQLGRRFAELGTASEEYHKIR